MSEKRTYPLVSGSHIPPCFRSSHTPPAKLLGEDGRSMMVFVNMHSDSLRVHVCVCSVCKCVFVCVAL